jgi:hypothetical protein
LASLCLSALAVPTAGMTKEISGTSMASTAQPHPHMTMSSIWKVNTCQEQGLCERGLHRADELRRKRQIKYRRLRIEHIRQQAFQEALRQSSPVGGLDLLQAVWWMRHTHRTAQGL